MSATGPEGEGGAGSVAVATVGEPTAGSAFKMRSRAPSSPHPQFLGPKECVFFSEFQSWNAHQILFPNSASLFQKWGNKVQGSRFTCTNLHS